MIITVTKLQAARRHLDTAIALHFGREDSVSVHTLAAAAFTVMTDVVEAKTPGQSWRSFMVEDTKLTVKELLRRLRHAQNFFKHAADDPEGVLEFEELENDHLLYVCIQQYKDIAPMSLRMQAFEIWFLALHADWAGDEPHPAPVALEIFPNLAAEPRKVQLAIGEKFLTRAPTLMQLRPGAV